MIALLGKKDGKHMLVFNDVIVNISLREWEICNFTENYVRGKDLDFLESVLEILKNVNRI